MSSGVISGVRVIEIGGVGPIPFCSMHLADLGADVIRIDRPISGDALSQTRAKLALLGRGKRAIALDLKSDAGRKIVLDLIAGADIALEGFRPGVAERLGVGPDECLSRRPSLVYGRMTGWGSVGPLCDTPAHDINFLARSGLLSTIGSAEAPVPPLNIIGDFGAAMVLVSGVLAALARARTDGLGQVVEASLFGGTLTLMNQLFEIADGGEWVHARASNWMDGGAPFYRAYETADGRFMAVGAVEPQFYRALLDMLELGEQVDAAKQFDRATWDETARTFADRFLQLPQSAWVEKSAGVNACCTPVLDLIEARSDPDHAACGAFVASGGATRPGPHPLFSKTPSPTPGTSPSNGADAVSLLRELGRGDEEIEALFASGVVSRPNETHPTRCAEPARGQA